jgi:hypothetical protein
VAPLDAGGPWRGTFELATTGDVVAWQATWDDGKKVARARYEHERTGQIVDVTVDAARAFGVEARVGGVVVDGIGAPTPVEAGALEALAADGLGLAIAGVNLELACVVDGEAHGRPLRAAMMYPWQLLVKYDAAFPGMHTLADHTRCRWTEDALDDQAIAAAYDPGALPDDGEALRALFEGAWRRADVDGSVVVARLLALRRRGGGGAAGARGALHGALRGDVRRRVQRGGVRAVVDVGVRARPSRAHDRLRGGVAARSVRVERAVSDAGRVLRDVPGGARVRDVGGGDVPARVRRGAGDERGRWGGGGRADVRGGGVRGARVDARGWAVRRDGRALDAAGRDAAGGARGELRV